MSAGNYGATSNEDPFLNDLGSPGSPQEFPDDPEDPFNSGPSSKNFISENLDYEQRDGDGNPIFKEKERTWGEWFVFMRPALKLVGFLMLKVLSSTLISPLVPYLLEEYYGGGESGRKQAASVQTYFDASRAFVALLFVPIYGKLLDTIGRKPFFILTGILNTLPPAFLFALPANPIWYILFNEIASIFSTSYSVSYIADCYEERDRAKVFAWVVGVPGLGVFIAIASAAMDNEARLILSLVFALIRIPFSFFAIPETLPRAKRRRIRLSYFNPNPLPSLRVIFGNKVMKWITVIVAMLVTTAVGASEVQVFYLMQKINLSKTDNFIRTLETGLLLPLTTLVIFPLLSKCVRPTRLVFISFISMISSLIAIMITTTKWEFFVIVLPLQMGIEIGVPSLVGIFSNAGEQDTQGMRMAGITAVMDLVSAITPLIIGAVFHALPEDLSWLSFLICLVFSLPALPIVFRWLPMWVSEDRDEQIRKSFTASFAAAHGDQPGGGKSVAQIAKECADNAERRTLALEAQEDAIQ